MMFKKKRLYIWEIQDKLDGILLNNIFPTKLLMNKNVYNDKFYQKNLLLCLTLNFNFKVYTIFTKYTISNIQKLHWRTKFMK